MWTLSSPTRDGIQFSSFQFSCSAVSDPWTAACQAFLSITNSWSLLKLMSVEPVMPSNHLIFCCPHLRPPSIFPSIRIFSNESVLPIRCQSTGVSALASVLPGPLHWKCRVLMTGLSGKSLDYFHFLFKFSFLVYFWLCWVFIAACGLYVVVAWLLLLRNMHFKILITFFFITFFISIFSLYVYLYIGFFQFCRVYFFLFFFSYCSFLGIVIL